MDKGARVYREILRLVRRLPKDTRPYYAQYLRENIVNYPKIFDRDFEIMDELFRRAYNHSIWVLNKYSVDQSAADKLKRICYESYIYYRRDNSYEWWVRVCLPYACFYSSKGASPLSFSVLQIAAYICLLTREVVFLLPNVLNVCV